MKELTLIIPAKEESNSLPRVLEEVKNLELKKLIVLAEDDYQTINSIKMRTAKFYFKQKKAMGIQLEKGSCNNYFMQTCSKLYFCFPF